MIEMNLVSVIIPIHNRFTLADEAVDSVYAQTYRPIQLILVDDCSDQPYRPKITSQPEFEIIFLRHETNQGPGASRETGRLTATGDYLAYLDSDDLWHQEKLEKQVAMLKSHPKAGMCYCASVEFSNLPLTGKEHTRKHSDQPHNQFLPAVLSCRPWGTGACLWTRQACDAIGPWFPGWAWEDYEYDFRAGCHEINIIYVPEKLCYFRIYDHNDCLSCTPPKERFQNKSASLLEISRNLKLFNKIGDEKTNYLFFIILYNTSMSLFYQYSKSFGRIVLKEAISISNYSKRAYLVLIYLTSFVIKSNYVGRLMRKVRFLFLINREFS